MPKNTDELVSLLDLEEIEQGLYRGEQPQTLLQQTFGGQVLAQSLVAGVYEKTVDRESAHEKLKGWAAAAASEADERSLRDEAQDAVRAPRGTASKGSASQPAESGGGWLGDLLQGSGRKDSVLETVAKSAARTIGSSVGREIIRGVLGSLLGGSRRR